MNTQFIQVTDRTRNPHKVIGLERNETAGSLGGYPKHIEDVPESLWKRNK